MKRKKQKGQRSEKMSDAKKEPPSSDIGKYIQLFGLLLVLGVIGSSYMKKEGGEAHSADQSSEGSASSPVDENITSFAEQIRLAVVSVKTSWGRGSGFFIRKNFIITCNLNPATT